MVARPHFQTFLSLGPRGFHRIAYTDWGDPANPHIVVCVHGLTRNSRDFDYLAARLARDCRVVCMDVVGRGASDWLAQKSDYGFALYQSDAAALVARVMADARAGSFGGFVRHVLRAGRASRVDWIGTSMGGLLGMMLASKPGTPITRLVLNDVGPLVPWPALGRLKSTVLTVGARFPDLAAAEQRLREACATFGPLSDAQWRHVARHSVQPATEGGYMFAYDPGIISTLRAGIHGGLEFSSDFLLGVDLWPVWDVIQCPTLVLRGAESDLLLESTAQQMTERGPKARLVEFPGVGHAPWLIADDQIRVVREFLLEQDQPQDTENTERHGEPQQ